MRTLLFGANLPAYLWGEAARTANFVSNRMLHRALHRITPLEKFSGKKPDISLRIFGCLAYLHLQKCSKLQPKAKPLILVGYGDQSKAYRCLDPVRKKIVISRDIHFDESIVGIPVQKHSLSADDDILRIFLHNNSSHPTTSHFRWHPIHTPVYSFKTSFGPTYRFPRIFCAYSSWTRLRALSALSPL